MAVLPCWGEWGRSRARACYRMSGFKIITVLAVCLLLINIHVRSKLSTLTLEMKTVSQGHLQNSKHSNLPHGIPTDEEYELKKNIDRSPLEHVTEKASISKEVYSKDADNEDLPLHRSKRLVDITSGPMSTTDHGNVMNLNNTIVLYINRNQEITNRQTKEALWMYKKEAEKCVLPEGYKCKLSSSEERAVEADGILHVPSQDWLNDPLSYKKGQKHIWFQPVPLRISNMNSHLLNSFFDITMTYKESSTIPLLNICHKRNIDYFIKEGKNATARKELLRNRNKDIAVFMDGCKASGNSHYGKNTIYLRALMEHIKIDSYGTCFHNKDVPYPVCSSKCYQNIAQGYKMVLALDDPTFEGYIGEDIFLALRSGSVPVYLGSDNIYNFIPGAHTLIYANDYRDPEELATFLEVVLNTPEMLEDYQESWNIRRLKKIYKSVCFNGVSPVCRLCEMLYEMKT